jgi:CHAT domain-containing protein/Tfp pilus assembly protein PilF
MYKLRTVGPPYEVFLLKIGAYRLGSASDSEMVLNEPSVAPYHCEIMVTAKTIQIRDLSSNHETFVDDQQVASAQLKLGQKLRLGNVTLVMEDAGNVAAAGASADGQAHPKAAVAAKRNLAFLKPLVLPGLALLGLVSVVALIWFSTARESRQNADSAAARGKRKPAKETSAEDKPVEAVSEEQIGASKVPASTKPGAAVPLKPGARKPPAPFNPNDTKVPPKLDVQAAEAHLGKREFSRAEPLLQRALRNQVSTLGADHPDVTKTIAALGQAYEGARQFDKAEPCFQQVVNAAEKANGPEHPETATALNDLGEMYLEANQPAKAAPVLDRALKIREKALGSDHQDVGASLTNLALMNRAQGEFGKAKPLLERALKNFEKNQGTNSATVGQCLDELGELNKALGDDAQAERLLEQSLKLKEQNASPDDPALESSLHKLAALQEDKGDHAKAEALYQRALKNAEKAFGPDSPKTKESLDKLAELYRKMGEPAKAEPLAQRAEKIAEKSSGPDHPETAASLNQLAKVQQAMGDSAKAEPSFQRASNILAKALGPEHPSAVKNLEDLASLNVCEGDPARGPQLAGQAVRAKLRLLSTVLAYGSAQQRLAYADWLNPYSLAASANAPAELALAILRFKGVILDSFLEDRLIERASLDPKDQAMIRELLSTKEQLASLLFDAPGDSNARPREQREIEKNRLARDFEVVEGVLAHRVPGFGRVRNTANVTVAHVQNAIPAQAALVELIRYFKCVSADKWQPSYGAVLLTAAGDPVWIALGNAEEIDRDVDRYQRAVRDASETGQEITPLLQALSKQLWTPIAASLLPETKSLIFSPDGALSVVSFATLLTPDDHLIGEKYSVRYVSSGCDLLAERKSGRSNQAFVFCNPDFAAEGLNPLGNAETSPIQFVDRQDLGKLPLPPLPGTLKEAELAETQIKKLKLAVRVVGGAGASETQLAAVQSPRLLHLATHSFALPGNSTHVAPGVAALARGDDNRSGVAADASPASVSVPVALRNPVHRSGVVLAGGATTFKSWERGELPHPVHDGILTAEEAGLLKLQGTELVVLSVCGARVGGDSSGESVLALRRGFVQSGAENLLMTLWPVEDGARNEWLGSFYERFQQTGNAAQAFSEVQRESLVKLRKEQNLAAAVRLAGSFVLSVQGR